MLPPLLQPWIPHIPVMESQKRKEGFGPTDLIFLLHGREVSRHFSRTSSLSQARRRKDAVATMVPNACL